MPRHRRPQAHVTNVCVSFAVTYRATLEFFATKDSAMANYYPDPFPDWQRADRYFNLLSRETRRAIRFEPSRFVVRTEGHQDLNPYDHLIGIAQTLCETFAVKDIFGAAFSLIRVRSVASRKDARLRFSTSYLSDVCRELMPWDGITDYAISMDRVRAVNSDLVDMRADLAPLHIKHAFTAGPVDYAEIGQRFTEFTANADNELYRTDHVAPEFGVVAASQISLERASRKKWTTTATLWRFHDLARERSEAIWQRLDEALR